MKISTPSVEQKPAFARSFLLGFIPVAALLIGMGLWTVELIINQRLGNIQGEQASVLAIRSAILQEDIGNSLEKLQAIAVDPNLQPLFSKDTPAMRKRLEESFVTLLLRNRQFAQVRWIDTNGTERVRVDRREGKLVPISAEALQDKSQRDYFKKTLQLPAGKIFISPLDINLEHGRIEQPFRPILRFAMPLRDADTHLGGIIVINVNADSLLERVPRQHFTGSQLMWLDESGYWLRATDPNDEWGVQRGHTETFASRHPDVWRAMAKTDKGYLSTSQGLWSWASLDPVTGVWGAAVSQSPRWRLVSLLPGSTIAEQRNEMVKKVMPMVLISLAIFALLFFVQSRLGRKTAILKKERFAMASQLQKLVSHVPGVVYQYQLYPDGRSCLPYASEAIGDIYRVSAEEVRDDASKIFEVLHPEDREAVKASIQKSADMLTPWIEEYRVHYADGKVRWLSGNAMPEKLADGSFLWHGFIHDISERKMQQAKLETLAERLRATFNTALDCIIVMDSEGLIIEFNPAAEKVFGYRREEVIGRLMADAIVPEKYRQAHNQGMKHYLETGEGPVLQKRIEIEAIRKDGSEFPVELAIDVAKSEGKALFVAYLQDISERKLAQLKLLEREKELNKLALVASRTDNAVVLTDAAGRIEWVNYGFTRITGWFIDEIIGRKPGEFLQGPESDPETIRYMKECIQAGRAFKAEILNYDRNDHKYWIAIEVQPLTNEAGELINFMAIERDITKTKQDQATLEVYSRHLEKLVDERTAELKSNKALLEAVFKTTPNGLLLIDESGKIRMTNAALAKMFGFAESELLGQKLEILVPESQRQKHANLHRQYMLQSRTRSMGEGLDDLLGQRKDGSLFPIDVSLATLTVNDEQFAQATVADITARKLAEDALRDLNANLESQVEQRTIQLMAANTAKSEFLANMSHEIRTPMNGILGLAQLLEREPLTPDQQDMVARIRSAGHSMLGIINDVLDFSKIEAGQLRIDPQPFLLAPMLAQINSLMGHSAHAKGVDLHIKAPAGLDGILIGDGLRLEQILINLIGNAIKFTEQGEICVAVHTLALTEKSLSLRFEVKDTGIGIAQEHLASLFAPFTQADSTITRRYGGTGLGLSICKRLVALMGGQIGVESSVDIGSTFWFELPFERSAESQTLPSVSHQPSPVKVEGPRLSGLKLLVVDDSRMNLEVIERMLIREGARVTLAADGQQALQYLNLPDECEFDALLMDVQMPVLDGLAATRMIRGELGLIDLPVIAFTAGVLPEQRERAKVAGYNDFVAKPVEIEELVSVLLRWTSGAEGMIQSSAEEPAADLPETSGLNIDQALSLLDDDRDLFLELLKNFASEFATAAQEVLEDIETGDNKSAAKRLHKLRGEAGYLGAEEFSKTVKRLEDAINQQNSDLKPLVDDFILKLDDLLKATASWREL